MACEQALLEPWTQPLDCSGQPVTGWITVFGKDISQSMFSPDRFTRG